MWYVVRPQGIYSSHASWRVNILSLPKLWPLEMLRVKQTPAWSSKEERWNIWLKKRLKHQVKQKEQISLWSILFTLSRQLNYTNRKTEVVLGVAVLTTSCGIAPKTLAICMESGFKHQKRDSKEGRLGLSEASFHSGSIPGRDSLNIKALQKTPFLNQAPLTHWSGPKNIARVRINGESSWAVLDNGSTINAVTPEFVEAQSLDVGPFSDLVNSMIGINGFEGLFSQPLGYIILRVQVEGVRGYDKDQVALVMPDSTAFESEVPVTLGTLIINQIINMIKESKIDELLASLNGSRVSHLLACH